ncbi:MAG: arylsulfatase [Bacteroidales bacterium]
MIRKNLYKRICNSLAIHHTLMLAGGVLWIMTAAGCHGTGDTSSGTLPEKPNIVFILADDMGYSDLGCYGAELIRTPNLDRLASQGLRFTNFYNTGRCWPTRTCLLSGYYPHQVLSDPIDGVDYEQGTFRPVNNTWLPALLKKQGYRCYHSGKWHILRRVPQYSELTFREVGFDRSYKTQDGRHLRPVVLLEDGEPVPPPEAGSKYEASRAIVDHAITYLDEHAKHHSGEPFFSYIAFIAPHFPLQALQEDIEQYRGKFNMGWNDIRAVREENRAALGFRADPVAPFEPDRYAPWNLSQEELVSQIDPAEVARAVPWSTLTKEQQGFQATKMAIHAAMVSRMDREIGRFLQKLEELDYMDNTLIFFCSDNGASTEMMNRADKHTPGSVAGSADSYLCLGPGWSTAANTPFRLHKTWVHEGGIATPMLVHWPDGIGTPGEFRQMPAHVVDIAPTLLELAGIDPKQLEDFQGAPGISLVPCLRTDQTWERPPLFFHHEHKKAIRDGNWKAVTIEADGPWELYDLSFDRGETMDLSAVETEKLNELVSEWQDQRNLIVREISVDGDSSQAAINPGW